MRVLIILSALISVSLAHQQLLPVAYTTNFEEPRSSYEYSASVATQDYNNYVSVKSIDPALYRSQPIASYAYAPNYIRSAPIAYAQYASPPALIKAAPIEIKAIKTEEGQYAPAPIAYAQYASAPALIKAAPVEIKAIKTEEGQYAPAPIAYAQYASAPALIKAEPIEKTEPIPILKTEPAVSHDIRFDGPAIIKSQPFAQYAYPAPAYLRADQYLQPPIIKSETLAIKQEPFALYNAQQQELTPVLRPIIKTHEPIVKHYVPAPLIAANPQTFIAAPAQIKTIEHVVEPQVVGHAVVDQGLIATKTQYHSQDELGQAAYGHSEPLQSHDAVQDVLGSKAGSFSYVDPAGKLRTTSYIADENGYQPKTTISEPIQSVHLARRRRSAPFQYRSAFPLTYSAYHPQASFYNAYNPTLYSAPVLTHAPIAYNTFSSYPTLRKATLTNIVHNPGHSSSYRVD